MKQILLPTLLLGLMTHAFAKTDICNIDIGPDKKTAMYTYGDLISITTGFQTDEGNGVRIYARPYSGGVITPGYAPADSPLYVNSGMATCAFTITSGPVVVDEICIEVYSFDNSILIKRIGMPVHFLFGSAGVNHFEYSSDPALSSLLLEEHFTTSFQFQVPDPGGIRVLIKPISNGVVSPGYHGNPSGVYSGT